MVDQKMNNGCYEDGEEEEIVKKTLVIFMVEITIQLETFPELS